jgi:hypothetical protein
MLDACDTPEGNERDIAHADAIMEGHQAMAELVQENKREYKAAQKHAVGNGEDPTTLDDTPVIDDPHQDKGKRRVNPNVDTMKLSQRERAHREYPAQVWHHLASGLGRACCSTRRR